MIPTDLLRVIGGYAAEPVYRLRSGWTWSDGLLSNPLASDLIKRFLNGKENTNELASLLARNTNPEILEYLDPSRGYAIRDLCGNHSAKAMELLRCVQVELLHFDLLSANPYAIEILEKFPERVKWRDAADNPAAYGLIKRVWLEKEMDIWDSFYILRGVHSKKLFQEIPHRFPDDAIFAATPLFEERLRLFGGEGITMEELCSHPDYLHVVEQRPIEEWSLEGLSQNPNPAVVPMIQRLFGLVDTEEAASILSDCRHEAVLNMLEADPVLFPLLNDQVLCMNPSAVDFLLRNREKVNWSALAKNPSPRAIEVVMAYLPSFLASDTRHLFYARPEVLELDLNEYQKRVVEFVSKVKIF